MPTASIWFFSASSENHFLVKKFVKGKLRRICELIKKIFFYNPKDMENKGFVSVSLPMHLKQMKYAMFYKYFGLETKCIYAQV